MGGVCIVWLLSRLTQGDHSTDLSLTTDRFNIFSPIFFGCGGLILKSFNDCMIVNAIFSHYSSSITDAIVPFFKHEHT